MEDIEEDQQQPYNSQSEEGELLDENFVNDDLQLLPNSADDYAGDEIEQLAYGEGAVYDDEDEDEESVYGPDQDFEDEDEEEEGCLSIGQADIGENLQLRASNEEFEVDGSTPEKFDIQEHEMQQIESGGIVMAASPSRYAELPNVSLPARAMV